MNERAPLPPTLHAARNSCVLRNAQKSRAGFLHLSPGPVLRSVGFYRLRKCREVSPTLLGDMSCCMRWMPNLKSRETLGNLQGGEPQLSQGGLVPRGLALDSAGFYRLQAFLLVPPWAHPGFPRPPEVPGSCGFRFFALLEGWVGQNIARRNASDKCV